MIKTFNLVKSRYKNIEGKPFEMTPSQNEIFDIIFERKYPRNQAITYTQFGKSEICSQAVLTRITTFPEMWAIVAPSLKKAGIIMGYIIGHIFDNEAIRAMFKIGKDESLERIRRERRKDKITFNLGEGEMGGVFILSTEGKRVKDVLDAIMGFGAKNIVLDESGLIDDPQYAGVKRMLGGHKDNFLFEIGNPFRRNHFLRTWRDSNYHHIFIDYKKGIEEGRIKEEFINEMRKEAFFDVLYECKFPEEEAIDTGGYMVLITEKDLDRAYIEDAELFGELRMGVDVGAGGDKSVIVIRGKNAAQIVYSMRNSDTMSLVGEILTFKREYDIRPQNIFIDAIGVGKGVVDRLREYPREGMELVTAVAWGGSPEGEEPFVDLKAQSYWWARDWVLSKKLIRNSGWEELLGVKYKVQSDRKVKIRGKDEMLKEGIHSPDHADALALTFARSEESIEELTYIHRPKI